MESARLYPPALDALAQDLQRVFGGRLESLVAYRGAADDEDDEVHALALVDRVTFQDLAACAPFAAGWRRNRLGVPLILGRDEFLRTLDVFPLEYGGIIASHVVVTGSDPFADAVVADDDLRRACELQAKSHLIHLREGFLEAGGDARAVSRLIAASAPALRTLLTHIARFDPALAEQAGLTGDLVREIAASAGSTIADPSALLARYIAAVERLWQQVDGWRAR
jgi:hypothetical protein